MAGARAQHAFLQGYFGGKDMTLFHLQRMDPSDGSETLADIAHKLDVSVEDLRHWNKLTGNRITPGHKLITSRPNAA